MSNLGNKINTIYRTCRNLAGLIISSTLMVSACSTVTTQSFIRTGNANVEVSYVATDADFGTYHQLLGEDMGIFFPESKPLPEEDLQRIRQIFRDAIAGNRIGRRGGKSNRLVRTQRPHAVATQRIFHHRPDHLGLADLETGTGRSRGITR